MKDSNAAIQASAIKTGTNNSSTSLTLLVNDLEDKINIK